MATNTPRLLHVVSADNLNSRIDQHYLHDSNNPPVKKRRGNLPREVTEILRSWLNDHVHHPYPTESEKAQLIKQTGLTLNQISNWFINARRRRLPGSHKNKLLSDQSLKSIESP